MRKLKKVISLAVVIAVVSNGMDMGTVFAADISERQIITGESMPAEAPTVGIMITAAPTLTPCPVADLTKSPILPDAIADDFIISSGVLMRYQGDGGAVEIPSGIKEIGGAAFCNCSNIKSVKIPSGVTSIGNFAFSRCDNLESIEIPSSVKDIGGYAFEGCGELESIELPAELSSIGKYAFKDCSSLENAQLPTTMTSLGIGAFYGCTSLKSIQIPEGVRTIGAETLAKCTSLECVELPSSLIQLENQTFENCSSIKSIKLPEGITDIGDSAFAGCSSLSSIELPEGITDIGDRTFYECSSLSSIELPDGLKGIGSLAFGWCSSLKSIELPEGLTNIGIGVFGECSSLETIKLPEGITQIDCSMFERCRSLSSIELPEGITSIGSNAFLQCNSLKNVELPKNVESIGESAFEGCRGLESIELPEGLRELEKRTFAECISLKNIELPSNIISIDDGAFAGSGLCSIELPKGLMKMGQGVFSWCTNLQSVDLSSELTNIGTYTFSYCNHLKNVMLPKTLRNIDEYTFYQCESLKDLELPESLETIGKRAFAGCNNLESIMISKGVADINEYAFEYVATSVEIICEKGSYAESYASKYSMPYRYIENVSNKITPSTPTKAPTKVPHTTPTTIPVIHKVYDESDLQQMINYPNDTFQLMNDIKMENSWETVKNFSGLLDGCGYTISDVDNTIFEQLSKNSVVKNLNIIGKTNDAKEDLRSGLLVSTARGIIENCTIKGSIQQSGVADINYGIIRECTNEANITRPVSGVNDISIGGIVTQNAGTIIKCTNIGTIESTIEDRKSEYGGIAAINSGLIIDCVNEGKIISPKASTGGIVDINSGLIYKCTNKGFIRGDLIIRPSGGICGAAKTFSYIIGCKNYAQIDSGICGYVAHNEGMLDDDGEFTLLRAEVIIADCENIVNGISGNPLYDYKICGGNEIRNGQLRITRCKNIVDGESVNVYVGNRWVYYGDFTQTGVSYREVCENGGELQMLEPTIGEPISMQLGENKKICSPTEVDLAKIFIDNPLIGTLESDGTYVSQNVGESTAYYVYDDGSIVLHTIEVNSAFQSIENSPIPTVALSTPDVPQVSITPIGSLSQIVTSYPTTANQIQQKAQTITAKNITKTYGDKAFNLGAKTTGDGMLTYTSSDKKVAIISASGKVTIKGYGKTTVTIKATATSGYKAAQKKITITIKPKKQTISSVKSNETKIITVKWKKDTKANGYILQYSTDKKFKKDIKTVKISNNKTTSKTIGKLKAGKKYYVRICAYKQSSKKIKGSYSGVKSVTVKK